ncbi:membrane-targeted effector domain-containing toxin [Legionella spiritensis]|uniref:membrane-targeted effector domain-containing toxin n=1 Tax=Legionella spiritensis TaxID=452 RepID=UPI000F6D378D|nr:membrane-targeted effector domain-containing toxin [Legionella spiritensis]VEG91756.1 Uncharacterised protein [Legionella spiritensis]
MRPSPVYSIHPGGKFYNWKTPFGFDHSKDDVRELVVRQKYQERYEKFKEEIRKALPGHIEYDDTQMRIDIIGFSPGDYYLVAAINKLQEKFPWLHELSHYQTPHSRTVQSKIKQYLDSNSSTFFTANSNNNNNSIDKPRPEGINFDDLWKNNLVVSEAHEYICSKKFIIENLPYFKAQGYDTLFLEHLFTDTMQNELDNFMRAPPDADMPPLLQEYLRNLDRGHMFNPPQQQFLRDNGINPAEVKYTFTNLIIAAKKAGIRVVGLDTSVSYKMQEVGANSEQKDLSKRIRIFNYEANSIILNEVQSGKTKKWLALMGNTHAEQFEGYPGVSQLQAAQTVVVSDRFSRESEQPTLEKDVKLPADAEERNYIYGAFLIEAHPDCRLDIPYLSQVAQKAMMESEEIASQPASLR